jgi:uncharacterized protein YjbI with pentapeptide repeats
LKENMKHQIKGRFTGAVLFECELPDDTAPGLQMRDALEKAVSTGANLAWADLTGANLAGADLDGANLARANLTGADLTGAKLTRANLDGANLDGANLAQANLAGAELIGGRPIFMIGPIGSRCAYFTSYNTDKGIMLRAGCFFGTIDEFMEKLSKEHQDNNHAKEYLAALELIKCHASIWE